MPSTYTPIGERCPAELPACNTHDPPCVRAATGAIRKRVPEEGDTLATPLHALASIVKLVKPFLEAVTVCGGAVELANSTALLGAIAIGPVGTAVGEGDGEGDGEGLGVAAEASVTLMTVWFGGKPLS